MSTRLVSFESTFMFVLGILNVFSGPYEPTLMGLSDERSANQFAALPTVGLKAYNPLGDLTVKCDDAEVDGLIYNVKELYRKLVGTWDQQSVVFCLFVCSSV